MLMLKYKKRVRLLVPHIKILSHTDVCHPLFYSNFLHATIAILHDIQSLGWTYQSLTINRIARYFLGIGRGCNLINARRIKLYNLLEIAKF